MDNIDNSEQITLGSQPAEAEDLKTGDGANAISLGKFKDVNALLNAYNSLQAEFTKRCQRLKELEGTVKSDKTQVPDDAEEETTESKNQGITDEDKNEILKGYLKGVLGSKQKALVMDGSGVGVRTPSAKPKTIFEAGVLAKEIMQN